MSASLWVIVGLLNPCTMAQPIDTGAASPCTGILWSEDASRKAVKCVQVDIVKLSADLTLCERSRAAENSALLARAVTAEELLRGAPSPLPGWVLPVATGGAFVAGLAAGLYLGSLVL